MLVLKAGLERDVTYEIKEPGLSSNQSEKEESDRWLLLPSSQPQWHDVEPTVGLFTIGGD